MPLTKFTEKLISDSFKTTISGSDTAESSSFASRVTLVEAGDTSKTLVSSSVLSSPSQGTIRLATNGVNTDVDSGLQVGDSPTFAAGTITGDLSVGGTLTAQEVHTEFESASVIFTSGSTIFGDTIDDTHKMTGSLFVSGNIHLPNEAKINLGSSDDGNIKHSGTNLQIQETTGNIQLINYANDKDISLSTDDGSGGTTAYITLDGSATTVEVAKNTNFAGDVDVDGTTNLDVVDIDGAVTQDGGHFIINEGGADYDFRVESDGNTHALVMDGQQGFIGMGASAPGYVNGNDHRGGNTQTTSGAGGLLHLEGLVPRIILDDTGDTPQFAIEAQDYFSILELADDSTTETTRFRIAKDTGNIGIGVSSPGGDLVVSSSTKTDVLVGGNSSVFSDNGRSNVEINGSGTSTLSMTIGGAAKGLLFHDGTDSYFRNYANGYFAIYTNNSERVRINETGVVGIGTNSMSGHVHTYSDLRYMLYLESTYGTDRKYWFRNDGGTLQIGEGAQGDAQVGYTFDTANKRFGIGTRGPTTILHAVNSSGGDQTVARFQAHNYGDTGKSFIMLGTENEDGSSRIFSLNNTGNQSVLGFQVHSATSGQFTEMMRMNLTGVGINTNSPQGRLHIHNPGDGSGNVPSGGDEDTLIVSSSIRHFTALIDNGYSVYDSTVLGLRVPNRAGTTAYNFLVENSNDGEEIKHRGDGSIQARNTTLQGFDYAEFFEVALTEHTASGIPAGVTVALTGSKVIPASQSSEEPIGIVRPRNTSAIIGNSPWNHWHAKYKTTDYGAQILDENSHRVINSSYVSQSYTPREDRDEWVIVGLLGQIPVTNGQPTGSSWRKMHNISPTASMWFVK